MLLAPGICLALFGAKHFVDGCSIDAAVPVPNYMVAGVNVPKAAYAAAAAALLNANPRNGFAEIARAEAMMRAGASSARVIPVLTEGLGVSPASARGWTLLAENTAVKQKHQAAEILAQALVLAPRDYWLAGMRARAAAFLWPDLNTDTRALAISQTRLLWHEEQLRPQFLALADSAEGAALITHSFPADDIRAINRWLAQERSRSQ